MHDGKEVLIAPCIPWPVSGPTAKLIFGGAFKKIRKFRESFVGYVHRYQIAFRAGTKSYPLEYDW